MEVLSGADIFTLWRSIFHISSGPDGAEARASPIRPAGTYIYAAEYVHPCKIVFSPRLHPSSVHSIYNSFHFCSFSQMEPISCTEDVTIEIGSRKWFRFFFPCSHMRDRPTSNLLKTNRIMQRICGSHRE